LKIPDSPVPPGSCTRDYSEIQKYRDKVARAIEQLMKKR
jgi:hypothetical protein